MAAGFKQATVNASKVPSTQTNFPAYVDLSRLGITTLAEAQSVRVYSDSAKTTELAREIVSATEMHVKVSSLTSTFVLYVDWDGIRSDYAVTDTYGRNAVWSDYAVVSHQADTTNATGNANFTNSGVSFVSGGKIGTYGEYVSSSSDNMYIGDTTFLKPVNITMNAWVYPASITNSTYPRIIDRQDTTNNRGYRLYIGKDGTASPYITANINNGSLRSVTTGVGSIAAGNWYKVTATYDGSRFEIYLNGVSKSTLSTSGNISYVSSVTNFALGVNKTGTAFYLNGREDEVRVRTSGVSDDWETTEYNNQSDEATFWGTWSDVGGGGGIIKPNFLGFARL